MYNKFYQAFKGQTSGVTSHIHPHPPFQQHDLLQYYTAVIQQKANNRMYKLGILMRTFIKISKIPIQRTMYVHVCIHTSVYLSIYPTTHIDTHTHKNIYMFMIGKFTTQYLLNVSIGPINSLSLLYRES